MPSRSAGPHWRNPTTSSNWRVLVRDLLAADNDGDPNPDELDIWDRRFRNQDAWRLETALPLAITPIEADAHPPAWASSIAGDVEPRTAGVWLTWVARHAAPRIEVDRKREARRRARTAA